MKKFLFVAVLAAGTMVACNDTSNTVNGVDTTTQAYKDSVAGAMNNTTPMMGTGNDSTGTTTPMMGTGSDSGSTMMGSDSGSTMMNGTDSSK